jgi:hypothetical protein
MHPSRGERPRKALAFQSGVSTPGEARKPKVSEELIFGFRKAPLLFGWEGGVSERLKVDK